MITESMDSPHKLTDITDESPHAMMINMIHGDRVKNVKVHRMDDGPDHVLTFERDGNMEIHHIPEDPFSVGKIQSDRTGPNMRFASTAVDLAKNHVNAGGSVRIVATPETIEKFHGIAKKVASRNNAEPSDVSNVPDPEFYGWFGQKLSAFTVRKMT
jgi:hypothetical protein